MINRCKFRKLEKSKRSKLKDRLGVYQEMVSRYERRVKAKMLGKLNPKTEEIRMNVLFKPYFD